MSAAVMKVGFGVIAVVAIFEALQTQIVFNALLLFMTVGAVPGTDIVLSPNSTLLVLATILLCGAALWGRKSIGRSFRSGQASDMQAIEVVVEPESAPLIPVVEDPVLVAATPRQAILRPIVVAFAHAVARYCSAARRTAIVHMTLFRHEWPAYRRRIDATLVLCGELIRWSVQTVQTAWCHYYPIARVRYLKFRALLYRWLLADE